MHIYVKFSIAIVFALGIIFGYKQLDKYIQAEGAQTKIDNKYWDRYVEDHNCVLNKDKSGMNLVWTCQSGKYDVIHN